MRESRAQHTTSRWTTRRTRTLAHAVAIVGLAWIAACSSDSATGPGTPAAATPVGTYTIATANGKTLPFAIAASGDFMWEVTSGSIALTVDGKYVAVTNFRQTITGNVEMFVDSTAGTWAQSGPAIALTNPQDGSTGNLMWSGTQLTFADSSGEGPVTYVYAKK